jgi:hypothetical protein
LVMPRPRPLTPPLQGVEKDASVAEAATVQRRCEDARRESMNVCLDANCSACLYNPLAARTRETRGRPALWPLCLPVLVRPKTIVGAWRDIGSSVRNVLLANASSVAKALSGRLDAAEKPGIINETIFEPVVFRAETDQ